MNAVQVQLYETSLEYLFRKHIQANVRYIVEKEILRRLVRHAVSYKTISLRDISVPDEISLAIISKDPQKSSVPS